MNCIDIESNVEESSLTSQPGLSFTNISQRDQRATRRKQIQQDSSSVNFDSSDPDRQNKVGLSKIWLSHVFVAVNI